MNAKLDLDHLERLLETMTPAEIRAQFGKALRTDPRLEEVLCRFEGMDGSLRALKSAERPPEFRAPQYSSVRAWLPWTLPLAAALLLVIFAGSRLLPLPEKAASVRVAPDREPEPQDRVDSITLTEELDRMELARSDDEKRPASAFADSEPPAPPSDQAEIEKKTVPKERARPRETLGDLAGGATGDDIDSLESTEPEESALVEAALRPPPKSKERRSQNQPRQNILPQDPEVDRATAGNETDAIKQEGFRAASPAAPLKDKASDRDAAASSTREPSPLVEKELVVEEDRQERADSPRKSSPVSVAEEAAGQPARGVRLAGAKAQPDVRRVERAPLHPKTWLDAFREAWDAGDTAMVRMLFATDVSISWPLFGPSTLDRATLDRRWRKLMEAPRPPIHFELVSSGAAGAVVRWQVLSQSSVAGNTNPGGLVRLGFDGQGRCNLAAVPR